MRTVQIYVNDIRLDLFQDEKIEVTSSTQNIQDISKVFTDFSQSFTIPASKVNNGVFDHYYNNDVNGTFSAKNRVDARIEINHTPFRVGKIQLEGAEIKNNKAESYKITFFGDVVTLKDNFGEDKLQDLDYSSIQTEYNGAEVLASLTSTTDDDIRYPLISSNNPWNYGAGGSYDISSASSPMSFNELFPAVRVAKIFEIIAAQYNLIFTGNFLSDTRFTNMFTWWKNKKTARFDLEPERITFNNATEAVFTDDFVRFEYQSPKSYTPFGYDAAFTTNGYFRLNLYHYCDDVGATYYIDVYARHVSESQATLQYTMTFNVTSAGSQGTGQFDTRVNNISTDYYYSYQIRSSTAVTVYDVNLKYTHYFTARVSAATPTEAFEVETWCNLPNVDNPFILSAFTDLNNTAPDMKVADYFSGILKEFNLTCTPLQDSTTFQIEPLDEWYDYGGEIDITPYTIIDSIKVDRPKLYKSISFEWQKSKSFINEEFFGEYGREYGSLKSTFDYDGGDFKIKLPFENLYFNKFTDTNIQVAYAMTDSLIDKGYIPKVCNLYLDNSTDCSFYFNDGNTTTEVTSYVPLGQDTVYNGDNYSSNFGLDVSTLKNISIPNSLYQTYYEPYLLNLFNDKTRMVKLDCMLPLEVLTELTLDDTIILRDKKYRINTMKTDLTSGMVSLELLSDFTEGATTQARTINVISAGEVLLAPVQAIKPQSGGYYTITDTSTEASFITPSVTLPYTSSAQGIITFTASANTTGITRTNQFTITYYNANGDVIRATVFNYVQDFERNYLLREDAFTIMLPSKILTNTFDGILL